MTNEFKKECGKGMYWCNTDQVCKPIQEDVPVNNISSGNIENLRISQSLRLQVE